MSKSAVVPSTATSSTTPSITSSLVVSTVSITPSSSELDSFNSKLSKVGKPVLLSLVPSFCEAYVPLQSKGIGPSPLSEPYRKDYLALPCPELLTKCEETFEALSISYEQVKAVEEKTREQSNSKT